MNILRSGAASAIALLMLTVAPGPLMSVAEAQQVTRVTSMRRQVGGGALAEKLAGDTPWGLCDVAVIERVR